MTNGDEMQTGIKSAFFDLLDRMDANDSWAKCACCGEERNRLLKCTYYDSGEAVTSCVCVICGESARGVEWLASTFPGVSMRTDWPPALANRTDKTPRSMRLYISCGGMSFEVHGRAKGVVVKRPNENFEDGKFYPNCYQAWAAIKAQINNGEAVNVYPAETMSGKWARASGRSRI